MIISGLTNENGNLTPRERQLKTRLENAYRRGYEDHANVYRSVEPVNDHEAQVVARELRRFDDKLPDPSDEFWVIFTEDGNLIEGHRFWTGFDWASDIGFAARIPLRENAIHLAQELKRHQDRSYSKISFGQYKDVEKIDAQMPYRAKENKR